MANGTKQETGEREEGKRHIKAEGSKMVRFDDRVKIKGTKESKYLETDKVYSVHPVHAEKLIKGKHAKKATATDLAS